MRFSKISSALSWGGVVDGVCIYTWSLFSSTSSVNSDWQQTPSWPSSLQPSSILSTPVILCGVTLLSSLSSSTGNQAGFSLLSRVTPQSLKIEFNQIWRFLSRSNRSNWFPQWSYFTGYSNQKLLSQPNGTTSATSKANKGQWWKFELLAESLLLYSLVWSMDFLLLELWVF